jgi:hypothetical protein
MILIANFRLTVSVAMAELLFVLWIMGDWTDACVSETACCDLELTVAALADVALQIVVKNGGLICDRCLAACADRGGLLFGIHGGITGSLVVSG